jgi:iron complex transport system permease protein
MMFRKNASDDELVQKYSAYTFKKMVIIFGGILTLFLLMGISITVGFRDIDFFQVYTIVFEHITGATYEYHSDEWWDDWIVCNTRMPKVVAGIMAGIGLTVSGAAMQSVMKNPLADPYTTGISSAAVFGVTIAMIMGITFADINGQYGIVFNAFIFGMIPAAVVMLVSRMNSISPATLILAGIAISYFFSALDTLVMTMATAETIKSAYLWQIGSLDGLRWVDLPLMTGIVITGSIIMGILSKKLNILSAGDESATSLGLNVNNYRLLCLMLLSLMTASIISFTGIIGFVGLVVPHVCRIILGSDNKFIIPACAVLGPIVILSADIIGKVISPMGDLPMGIIMSFIGGPVFLMLIIKQRREMW